MIDQHKNKFPCFYTCMNQNYVHHVIILKLNNDSLVTAYPKIKYQQEKNQQEVVNFTTQI